jgi:uncharacterized membrane protein YczE
MLAGRGLFQFALLGVGYLLLAYFSFGIYLTCRLMRGSGAELLYLTFLAPYLGIFALSILGTVLAHLGRLRWGAVVLGLAVMVAVAACAYDLMHHRCQITGGGVGETYTIWWWYYEPFWYGYKPGNV